jgi:beta-lactamase regulating signal transducer with metallopeptidase domain
MLFVLFINTVLLGVIHHMSDWSSRRPLQIAVLFLPLVMLVLDFCSLLFSTQEAFPGMLLLSVMGGIVFGALCLGMVRLMLMRRLMTRCALFADPQLQELADSLAQQVGSGSPRVRLSLSDRPLALTCGLFKPTIVLSTWMVEHLDQRELEAVLVHELEHVARHDYLIIWLATMLRDAFFYLPTSWVAYRQLQHEKELACDDLSVHVTRRPLALASALTKVWLQTVGEPELARLGGAQALTRAEAFIDGRIQRLLAPSPSPRSKQQRTYMAALSLNTALLLPFGVFEVACLILLLLSTFLECHPVVPCGRL